MPEKPRYVVDRDVNSSSNHHDVPLLRQRLAAALAALDAMPLLREAPDETSCGGGFIVTGDALPLVVDAYNALAHADQLLPEIEAWCVVKYSRHSTLTPNPGSTWIGCTTKAQGEAMRAALDHHYNVKKWLKHWGDEKDRWTLEYRAIDVKHILNPALTAAEYVRGLG